MASYSPASLEHSDKSKKYDRQLRLWGDHGQGSLESSSVCLINATTLGTEILKSLVLSGIGSFTIIDAEVITQDDVDSNFFLDVQSVGEFRAEVAVNLLLDLNSDVNGTSINEDVTKVLENNPNLFANFAVVIGTSLRESEVINLSETLWRLNTPLIICSSCGFVAGARLQVQEHTVMEAHPDSQTPDLRLDCPFPKLKEYFHGIDLDSMEFKDHAHVPYVVVLYKYLQKFRSIYDDIPRNYKQKEQLRTLIRQGIKKDDNGLPLSEENFEEAIKAVNFAITPSAVPEKIIDLLSDERCINLTTKSKPFWIMTHALKDFIYRQETKLLPLRGVLPDMTAETKRYVELQQLYKNEANNNAESVYKRVQQLLYHLNQPQDSITENDVKLFCRCSNLLHVVDGSPISNEYLCKQINSSYIVSSQSDPDNVLQYYIMLRSIERYRTEYKSYPGEHDNQVELDIVKLKSCVSKLLSEMGCCNYIIKDDLIYEFCRYGGAEIHSVSSFLGGCIAQEVIKLITKQYIPFNNTVVYNGISSTLNTFVL